MNRQELVSQLKARYPRTQYYPGISDVEVEDLFEWLDRADIHDYQMDILLNTIKTHNETKSFPPLGKIRKWWQEQNNSPIPQQPDHAVVAYGSAMTVRDIYQRYCGIREKVNDCQPITNADGDFLHAWDDLAYMWDALTFAGWTEARLVAYLEKVKESIGRGEKANYETIRVLCLESETKRAAHLQSIRAALPLFG